MRTLPHQRCGFAILSNQNQKVKPVIDDRLEKAGKQAGADTTLQNAERCGAEFAWVPMGDTCSFCRMLASNGWQRQSKKAMKGGHAEHIHANCDCQYAVRFDGKGGVAGYDPDKYKAEYDAAEGDTWKEKLNSMRRAQYKQDGDKIRAQKRATYAKRQDKERQYNKNSDPLFDALGPASESHPEEIKRIRTRAEKLGVQIVEKPGNMAYSPGLHKGEQGQLHISTSDSYGAWLHEEQHMIDDMADGWPGFEGLFDVDRRCRMEYNAYRKEVEMAKSIGREDLADELRNMCRSEIEMIGGVWDAEQLP